MVRVDLDSLKSFGNATELGVIKDRMLLKDKLKRQEALIFESESNLAIALRDLTINRCHLLLLKDQEKRLARTAQSALRAIRYKINLVRPIVEHLKTYSQKMPLAVCDRKAPIPLHDKPYTLDGSASKDSEADLEVALDEILGLKSLIDDEEDDSVTDVHGPRDVMPADFYGQGESSHYWSQLGGWEEGMGSPRIE